MLLGHHGHITHKMTSLDPLKSAISIGNVDDTSLALPSVHQCRSGQQRVLEQVQTIRRTRSRHSSSRSGGSTSLSPTSPTFDSVFIETSKSGTSNGGLFYGNGFAKTLSPEKNINRQLVNGIKGTSMKKNSAASAYQYERGYAPVGSMAVGQINTSRSESAVARQRTMPKQSAPPQRLPSHRSTYRADRSKSMIITSAVSQPQLQPVYTMNGTNGQFVSSQGDMTKRNSQFVTSQGDLTKRNSQFVTSQGDLTKRNSQFVTNQGDMTKRNSQFVTNQGDMTKRNSQFVTSQGDVTKTMSQFIGSQGDVTKTLPKSPVTESVPKSKGDSGSNDNSGVADITMKEAVEYLSNGDDTYQHCGASYIQHNTFIDDKAKDEVLKFNGIHPLVGLLSSSSSQVNKSASAALRNLSFKSNSNKEEIHRTGGITEAVALLRDTDSVEIQKQLTGLLWNLSSVDSLKPDLVKSALPVLMERVILPYTTGPDRTSSNSQDPEVFFNATGCLRNLSSTKQSNRQAMRKCRGLVDSLVSYVKESVDAGNPDDKSVENCMCVLHNLTFQLEAEAPALFSRITTLAKPANRGNNQDDAIPIGCFSPQSKSSEHERHFDYPVVEDPQPNGAGQLIHSKTLQSYLTLLGTSQREETLEASCGALQNLTTHEGIVSSVMSQTIVQKLNGLQVVTPLIKSNKVNIQRNAVALVGNLTNNPKLHNTIARKALPALLGILSAGTKEGNESDDTLAMACQTANCLLMKEPEMGKPMLNNNLINSLKDLSQNTYFPKSSKSAALLLYNLWSEKDLQSFLKKQGMIKSSFVNDITTAAHKSVQVVD
ncbi:plakophilin-1 isoform X2 [Sebastes umbrosus]|uniref:plakophilin-1 isoform X2 n=1 Tax=Sebastes umbrosus TaxID=72105 RepID=UPI0018A0F78F|nr:plakophilin-1 isoform X2 [Sebastes umbrosus]